MPRNIKILVESDEDAENPLEESGFVLHSFSTRHSNFKHPSELGMGAQPGPGMPPDMTKALKKRIENKTAWLCSYFEHGECVWFLLGEGGPGTNCPWDGTRYAGLLECTLKAKDRKHFKDLTETARSLLKEYTTYANGHYLYAKILDDDSGSEIDSCCGISELEDFFKEHTSLLRDAEISYVHNGFEDSARRAVESVLDAAKKSGTLVPA